MAINRNNVNLFLEPILYTVWDEEFSRWPEEYAKIFKVTDSKKKMETTSGLYGFSLFAEKSEGVAIANEDYGQTYKTEITHTTYGKRFSVTREMLEDAQYEEVKKKASDLAISAKETVETLGAAILNNAFTSGTGGDGSLLCVTSHPLYGPGGGTEQNALSAAADLTVTSLQQAIQDMEDTRDDQNLRLNIKPTKLIIPKELKWTARELLDSIDKPYTSNNEINPLRDEELKYLVNHYLTDSDAWFLQAEKHGLICFWRRKTDFGQDTIFNTDDIQYKSTFRISFGWLDWRGIYGTPGV